MTNEDGRQARELLNRRLALLLPEEYQASYETLQPTPMRSAGLKYDAQGQVAWNEIWGSFCDLAMAGGPPHKGTLLEPGRPSDVAAAPAKYDEVAEEICRGIVLATELRAQTIDEPGWIRVHCFSETMAAWLLRAITMENIAVRRLGLAVDLPAAPHFRLEKEIKNVITAIAKTSHYWLGHMPREQRADIARLFTEMAAESPLVEPEYANEPGAGGGVPLSPTAATATIRQRTGLKPARVYYAGWLGLECDDVRGAVWMMRALVTRNVASRREGTTLFVPINPVTDPDGALVAEAVVHVQGLAGVGRSE